MSWDTAIEIPQQMVNDVGLMLIDVIHWWTFEMKQTTILMVWGLEKDRYAL